MRENTNLLDKDQGLSGLGNHISVTFQLPRFGFILTTLVTHRHLVLTALAKMRSTFLKVPLPTLLHFSLLEYSANRLLTMEAIEEIWPGLLSPVF